MSEEPRRSVRATKGQHTKSLDLLDQHPEAPKKRGKKAATKKATSQEASGAEEEEIIRCICGVTEQDDDSDESWIACEQCSAWQHNVCMGVTTDEAVLKDMDYYCEECKPANHKELLDAIARGEKLWEKRRQAFEDAQLEAQKVKKGGKKGKGKRVSDQKAELEQNGKGKARTPETPSADIKKEKKDVMIRAGSSKRKTMDGSQEESSKNKVRKVSTPQSRSTVQQQSNAPADIPATINELDKTRHGAAKVLQKALLHALGVAQKSGIYKASDAELQQKSLRLALEIERATHDTQVTTSAYGNQARKLAANIKSNQELCDRLLANTLTPSALAIMTDDEMASKELQRTKAEMQARADKQAILVTDDAPRVRRTHKGEELIEQDNFVVPSDETPTSRRRSMIDPNQGMGARSREASVGDGNELPQDIDDYRSQDDIRGNAGPQIPLSVKTKAPPQRKASQAGDFDINKVFSSVVSKSPTVPQHSRKPSNQGPPRAGPGEDADIDRMLDDDDEEPYSPKADAEDPTIVWRGSLTMNSVADFKANARHIGGADLSSVSGPGRVPWSDLIPQRLQVAGRIDQDKATEYLCGLRYSPATDVVVVALEPKGESGAAEFKKLYEYFSEKKRYGVVGNKGIANVRDTYLVPVAPGGTAGFPEFLLNFMNNKLPEERTEPMILVTLVIRQELQATPAAVSSFDGAGSPPPLLNHPQRQMSMGGSGPQMSPINPQGSFGSPVSSQIQPTAEQQQAEAQRRQHSEAQTRGETIAQEILGPLIAAPTVSFLMPQAWQMQPKEWIIVKEIFVEEPRAQEDLTFFSQLLEKRNPTGTSKQ